MNNTSRKEIVNHDPGSPTLELILNRIHEAQGRVSNIKDDLKPLEYALTGRRASEPASPASDMRPEPQSYALNEINLALVLLNDKLNELSMTTSNLRAIL